jgi:SAM-dependent methyltransferase
MAIDNAREACAPNAMVIGDRLFLEKLLIKATRSQCCSRGELRSMEISMNIESTVIMHYRHGALEGALLDGLTAMGKDLEKLTADELAPADEFHIGSRQATADFAAELGPTAGMNLIDIGCGIGGASRYFAQQFNCHVTGIDLSEEYITVAEALAKRVGLADKVSYRQSSAIDLPFHNGIFDGAYMQHVGMNIVEKSRLFREVRRVLKQGGLFGLYEIMRANDGALDYPLPWTTDGEADFIETPPTYRALLTAEGFEIVKERDRRLFALDFFRKLGAKMAANGGPPPFGMHILMGPTAPRKLANMRAVVERGTASPIEMICRRM